MILTSMLVDPDEFAVRTGWTVKPQGACKGEVCVPLPDAPRRDGLLDLHVVAERLGMPVVRDDAHGLFALGPESSITGRALTTAEAPHLELPDLEGTLHTLADLRPQKVVLIAWASW